MLPLFMPSQESIVTGEINFPLHESKLFPFSHSHCQLSAHCCPKTLEYPFFILSTIHSSLFTHPVLIPILSVHIPIHSVHIPIISSLSIQYPNPSPHFLSTNTQINVHRLSQIRSAYSPSAQQSLRK